MYDTAILIGRFQPVHNSHLALLRDALAAARQVVVVLGSAHAARSPRNPFTWQERAALLREALPEAERTRLRVLPVRDYYDEPRWARAVQAGVQELLAQQSGASSPHQICLVGHFKDTSSGYLRSFPAWPLRALPRQGDADATALRDAYFGGQSASALAGQVPRATVAFLDRFRETAEFTRLQTEWRALKQSHAAWAGAPYPPVFVTVDALLRACGHVLLVRRAHAPGQGLLALPGGFIDVTETLWQSCLRELAEETQCSLTAAELAAALQGVAVFDHPGRSQRGRTISHVHFFDVPGAALPPVHGGDDAAEALWVPVGDLPTLEAQFFDDHFHVLDHFLGLLPRAEAGT